MTHEPQQTIPTRGQLYPDIRPLSTVAETAEFLSCSERKVRGLIASGELEVVRVGRLVRVPRHALLDLVMGQAVTGQPEPPHEEGPAMERTLGDG